MLDRSHAPEVRVGRTARAHQNSDNDLTDQINLFRDDSVLPLEVKVKPKPRERTKPFRRGTLFLLRQYSLHARGPSVVITRMLMLLISGQLFRRTKKILK